MIVEVVSEYVALVKTGRVFIGKCPFHSEKTPSFTVLSDREFFHCFGCRAGGDVEEFRKKVRKHNLRKLKSEGGNMRELDFGPPVEVGRRS